MKTLPLILFIYLFSGKMQAQPVAKNAIYMYSVYYYADYKKLLEAKETVGKIYFHLFYQTSADSCKQYGLDFTVFENLNSFDLYRVESIDSVAEAFIIQRVALSIDKIKQFSTNSPFCHDYSKLNGLEGLTITGAGAVSNPSIGSLITVKYLTITNQIASLIKKGDPIFSMKNIEKIEFISYNRVSFPFEELSNYRQLKEIEIGKTDLSYIPESWKTLPYLEKISITSKQKWSVLPDYICEFPSLKELDLTLDLTCPEISECFFKPYAVCLQIRINTNSWKEKRTIKKYGKKWSKTHPECGVIYSLKWYSYNN